jgi:NAD+ synthase
MPGIVDETALGIAYEVLDKILWGLEHGWDQDRIVSAASVTADQVEHVRELKRRSGHLREMPQSPDLSGTID